MVAEMPPGNGNRTDQNRSQFMTVADVSDLKPISTKNIWRNLMKDDSILQIMLSKINKLILGKDETEKDNCKIDSEAQRIYILLRDAYQSMQNRNNKLDYYDFNPDTDEGIYIRNTERPSFAVVLQWGLSDFHDFYEFCQVNICKPCMDKDPNVSNLEFFMGISDDHCPNGRKRLRYNYILADELKFIDHGLEGCTHSFCKIAMKEKKN